MTTHDHLSEPGSAQWPQEGRGCVRGEAWDRRLPRAAKEWGAPAGSMTQLAG